MSPHPDQQRVRRRLHDELVRPVQITLTCDCLGAAAVLLHCGVATMAFLSMAPGKEEDEASDYEAWVSNYLKLGEGLITPTDLWSSRNGLLHTRTTHTRLRKKGKACPVVYVSDADPPVSRNNLNGEDYILVSLKVFGEAFEAGIDRCVADLFADSARQSALLDRMELVLHRVAPSDPNSDLYDAFFDVQVPWKRP